ncbi:TonB-dependent receptor [Desulfobacterales bacterium HSG2]|nr:TonB-dependent receptor [Desulfobacterales bacterium HSG2]
MRERDLQTYDFIHIRLQSRQSCLTFLVAVIMLMLLPPVQNCRADNDPDQDTSIDFTEFSLEELKDIEIISVSKKPEKLSGVSAAVFVITQEDIRRSGATSIPDALRLAPGVQVARDDLTDWEVIVRGFNKDFSNNLLVLIDGRSVYSPVFSGVYWDVQDTVLADIERIEVIRGPGATVWGANAVNGVINIITKSAKETRGGQVTALGGAKEGSGSVRYGGTIGKETFYRAYVKYFNREGTDDADADDIDDIDDDEESSSDNWRSLRGGFRMDRTPETGDERNSFTIQGEAYINRYDTQYDRFLLSSPYVVQISHASDAVGGHLLGRWRHACSETSETVLQFYYDHADKDYDSASANGWVDTYDLEFRNRFSAFSRHEIVWGLGYRFITDKFFCKDEDMIQVGMTPITLDQSLYSAFLQDEIRLIPDRLILTIGSKIEHNDYTGFEIQPSIRFLWTPKDRHTIWGAVSRAVRTPSRYERNIKETSGIVTPDHPILEKLFPGKAGSVNVSGNEDLNSETLMAYEFGYRLKPSASLWLDTTAFYYDYDELIGYRQGEPHTKTEPSPHYVIPYYFKNNMKGEAYGVEIAADWQAVPWWRLRASYSYLKAKQYGSVTGKDFEPEGSNPNNQFSTRSFMDITKQLSFDLWLRYVDSLSENDVDSYITLDARLSWKPLENLELSVVGQDILEERHQEFSSFEIEREVYFKADWRF